MWSAISATKSGVAKAQNQNVDNQAGATAIVKFVTPTRQKDLNFPTGKTILSILFLVSLIDSLLAPRGASPGHGGSFWLAWVFFTRLFLQKPSSILVIISFLSAVACVASNHGIVVFGVSLRSFYFYFATGLLIVFWEKIVHSDRNISKLESQT